LAAKSPVSNSTRHLMISIHKNDPLAIRENIKQFKGSGIPLYLKLMAIPDRIPALTIVYGQKKIHAVVTALLTSFCNSFNVIRPMSTDQIVQCAFDIIESCTEDFLAMEDLVIFFDHARLGHYGKIYDRLDQQTIFEMLEQYREKRHQAFMSHKQDEHTQFKVQGPDDRTPTNELQNSLANLTGRLSEMKERLKESKE
jgi:hypothetical protein